MIFLQEELLQINLLNTFHQFGEPVNHINICSFQFHFLSCVFLENNILSGSFYISLDSMAQSISRSWLFDGAHINLEFCNHSQSHTHHIQTQTNVMKK